MPFPPYDVSITQQDLENENLSLYLSFSFISFTHQLFPHKQSLASSWIHGENELWRRLHEYEVHFLSTYQSKDPSEQIDEWSSLHDVQWDRDTSDDLQPTTKNSKQIIHTFNVSFCWLPFTPNLYFNTLNKSTAKWICEEQDSMLHVE